MVEEKLLKIKEFLESDYKSTESKTIVTTTVTSVGTLSETKKEEITTVSPQSIIGNISTISAISILILPLLSFFYLVFYLDVFGISYDEIGFNINDLTAILYQKGAFYLYISIAALFPLVIVSAFLSKKIFKNLKNWGILIIIFCLIFIFHLIVCNSTEFPQKLIFSFDFFILTIGIFYFFSNKAMSYFISIGVLIFLFRQVGINDAQQRKNKKPRFNIVLKDEKIILSETDTRKYFIRKTSDLIFIMNEKDNKVEAYPSSDLQFISFLPKEK